MLRRHHEYIQAHPLQGWVNSIAVTAVFIHKGYFQMRAQEQLTWITVRCSIIKAAATGAEKGTKLSLTMDGDINPMG